MTFVDGASCPDCSGTVTTDNGTDYECSACGRSFDVADLFYP